MYGYVPPPGAEVWITGLPAPEPVHTLPAPGAGHTTPGQIGGGRPTLSFVEGTEGSERFELTFGALARGGGGDDVFVLSAPGKGQVGPLAFILDFSEGDSLDLSAFGETAKVLATEAGSWWAPDRIAIDFDDDGREDGFLLVQTGRVPDFGDFQPMPMPTLLPAPPAFVDYDPAISNPVFWLTGFNPMAAPEAVDPVSPAFVEPPRQDGWLFY